MRSEITIALEHSEGAEIMAADESEKIEFIVKDFVKLQRWAAVRNFKTVQSVEVRRTITASPSQMVTLINNNRGILHPDEF